MENILKNIYKKSDFVLSANFSIPWLPSGIWDNTNLLKLKSKIKDKLYLWISSIKSNEIVFSKVFFVDKRNNSIDEIEFSQVNEESETLKKEIAILARNLWIKWWIEFTIYSEIPRWHWLGFSGVLASLISSSIYILAWEIQISDLESSDLISKDIFTEIYNFAYKLENISKYNNTNWENSFISFLSSKNPILFAREKEKYTYLDLMNQKETILPFDYFIIFSGLKTNTKKIEEYLERDKQKFDKLSEFLEKNIISKMNLENSFLDKYTKKWQNYDSFFEAFSRLNIKLLKSFYEIWTEAYSDNLIEDFINTISEHTELISMIEWKSEFLKYFHKEFNKLASLKEVSGIMPIYSSKMWGWFLVVTKENFSRETITKTIEKLSDFYPKAYIEFASFDNNQDISWIKIEYFLEKWIIPNEFKKYLLLDNLEKNILATNIDEALTYDFDILLDKVKNKVYIKWEKLNSKDLHSQSTLIEIFSKLLENKWKWLSNKLFPVSTYTNSKSEMWWKIVYPMRNLLLEKLGKEIKFELRWESSNFEIFLDTDDIKIGIIREQD